MMLINQLKQMFLMKLPIQDSNLAEYRAKQMFNAITTWQKETQVPMTFIEQTIKRITNDATKKIKEITGNDFFSMVLEASRQNIDATISKGAHCFICDDSGYAHMINIHTRDHTALQCVCPSGIKAKKKLKSLAPHVWNNKYHLESILLETFHDGTYCIIDSRCHYELIGLEYNSYLRGGVNYNKLAPVVDALTKS